MIHRELLAFITVETARGHARSALEPLLLQHGWTTEDIDSVYVLIDAIRRGPSVEPQHHSLDAHTQPLPAQPVTHHLSNKRWIQSLGVSLCLVLVMTLGYAFSTGYFKKYPDSPLVKLLR